MNEIWADITGYDGFYAVSSLGRVKSLKRVIKQGERNVIRKEKLLKHCNDGKGYQMVSLSIHGKHKTIRVHRLVAEAFIPNPEEKKEVNHKNGDKSDNAISNLEWNTRPENMIHAIGANLAKVPPPQLPVPVNKYGLDNELISAFSSIKEASENSSISAADICKCCKGKRKTAGGFIWKYKREVC